MSQTKVQLIQPIGVMTAPGVNVSGTLTATTFDGNLTGAASSIIGTPNVNAGIITAVSFYGNGENLTGVAGSTFIGVVTAAQSGTTTIDLSLGNIIYFTQDTDTTVAFANTESTQVVDFIRTKDDTTTPRSITWPDSVLWNGGTAPTLIDSGSADDVQIFKLITRDQGVTWYGYEAMKNDPNPYSAFYLSGRNSNQGQFGLNDVSSDYSSPVQIPGTQWSSIHRSIALSYGLKSDGTLWSWGTGNLGATAQGDEIPRSSPTQIPGTQWTAISGSYSMLGTKSDGTLWGWGWNSYGELGQNDTASRSSPIQIPGTQWTIEDCYNGSQTTVARKTDGSLWVCGRNYAGALGLSDSPSAPYSISSPRQIPGTQWNSISLSSGSGGFATKTDGSLWSWGYNARGSLGHNDVIYRSSPTVVSGSSWQKVMSLWDKTPLFLKTDGTLWSWGNQQIGNYGQLGDNDGSVHNLSSPTQIPGTQWNHLIGKGAYRFATKTDGTLWAWGYNTYGELGINDTVHRSSPTQIPGTDWSISHDTGSGEFVAFKSIYG